MPHLLMACYASLRSVSSAALEHSTCSASTLQDHELDALPGSERNLEASMQDVQAKLDLIKQLQPLWLRSCRLSPSTTTTVCCLCDSCRTR